MRIVIDMPEEYRNLYETEKCKSKFDSLATNEFGYVLRKAFENGTPLPKGHWIKHNTPNNTYYYDCSLCGCVAPCTETADSYLWKLSNFCPDCGAKMEND